MHRVLKKLQYLGANAMAAVMDFGVGALIAVSISALLGVEVSTATFLLGGVLALVPDFDVVPRIFSLQFVDFDHHATLFHRPLIMIPVTAFIALLLGGVIWFWIALVCVAYHFLHDIGWTRGSYTGIALFWPLSDKCWSWFGSYEQPEQFPHRAWLDTFWLKPTKKSVGELTVGLIAFLVALSIAGTYSPLLVLIPVLIVLGSLFVWLTTVFARRD